MEIKYSKQAVKFLNKQSKSVAKERILGALTIMSEEQAQRLWNLVKNEFAEDVWSRIEETEPDDIDLKMFNEIKENPDCSIFVASDDVYKELGL